MSEPSKQQKTAAQSRGRVLVPVANPETVAPLIAMASAASEIDGPTPRVLALVHRSSPASSAQESDVPSPTPALMAAIAYAQSRGIVVDPHTIWSAEPAADILAAAQDAQAGWVLLGYHRGAVGGDTMGGVVRDVFSKAEELPINVGVFIQGTDQPIERLFVAVDAGSDGRAALDLAVRIAQKNGCKVRAVLVSSKVASPEAPLVEMVREARVKMGKKFHSDVLTKRTLHQLWRQTPGQILIVGRNIAEEVALPLDEVPSGDRCVIVVQGATNS